MSIKDKAAALKEAEGLDHAHEEEYNSKDDSGRFGDIFRTDVRVKKWKCKESEHLLDFIPSLIGKNHPSENMVEGKVTNLLDIWVHYGVGPGEDQVICHAKTYKPPRPCPICNLINLLTRKDAEKYKDEISRLKPSRRHLYNIWCHDSTQEEEEGVQIFNASQWIFGKQLTELSKAPRKGSLTFYSHPTKGKSVAFKRKGAGATNTEFVGLQFLDRDEPAIPDHILEQSYCLDEIVNWRSFDEIKALFDAGNNEPTKDAEPRVPKEHTEMTKRDEKDLDEAFSKEPEASSVGEPDPEPEKKEESKAEVLECPHKTDKEDFFGKPDTLGPLCETCEIWDKCFAHSETLNA